MKSPPTLRAHSNIASAAATEALSEPAVPRIGMKRTSSQAFAVAVPRPLPLRAYDYRAARRKVLAEERVAAVHVEARHPEAGLLELAHRLRDVAGQRDGHAQRGSGARLDYRPGRQAAAALRNQDGGGSGGLRAAYHRARGCAGPARGPQSSIMTGSGAAGKLFEKLVRVPELRLRQVGRDEP